MIHEYALEPDLVATWVDRHTGRYFVERFGLGQPRIPSRFPKSWKKLVWQAFQGGSDIERTRLTELIARLSERMVQRSGGIWSPEATWLQNAESEHARVPFHAILAVSNPRAHASVLVANDLDESQPLWGLPRGRHVERSAPAMAAAVAAMLRNAQVVILVDPYFGPEKARHRRPLRAFLRCILELRAGSPPNRIEIHCSADGGATIDFFRDECQAQLPGIIPNGLQVELRRLRERAGGERLHNRYILTDLGGVAFGVGLDDGDAGDTDDIHLLDRVQYQERWQQYGAQPPAFDLPEPAVIVLGKA